jgi:hypothetical protein
MSVTSVSRLADLTGQEVGGLGGLDFEEEEQVPRAIDSQPVDLDCQVCGLPHLFPMKNFDFLKIIIYNPFRP